MKKSRRQFLKTSTMVVVATTIPQRLEKIVAAQPAAELPQIPPQAQNDPLFYYKRASFSPYIDSIFEVSAGALSARVTLAEISDTGVSKPAKSKRVVTTDVVQENRFLLLFRGPLEIALRQDVYNVRHAALGTFRLLLVPVRTPLSDARYYEAVINRVLS